MRPDQVDQGRELLFQDRAVRSFPLVCKNIGNSFFPRLYFFFFPNKCLNVPARAVYGLVTIPWTGNLPPPFFTEIFICEAYANIFTHSFGKKVVFGS